MPTFKIVSACLFFCLSCHFSSAQTFQVLPDQDELILCSTATTETLGTCYGKANCTACTNCKYCGHCNSGGSCGVCTRRSTRKSYTAPRTYSKPTPSTSRKTTSKSRASHSSTARPVAPKPDPLLSTIFTVTKSTSLRQRATHQSKVLSRFSVGDQVSLLEKTDRYWWKVNYQGRIGWVKCLLLKKQK